MTVFEAIKSRTSYRRPYLEEKVPREDLMKILEAGYAAPSGCNAQTTSFICVDDEAILAKLRENMRHPVGKTAPALIFILAQDIPSYHGKSYSVQDYAAAIENILLETVELGYQSCWVEGFVKDDKGFDKIIAEILGVPAEYRVVAMLPIGKAGSELSHVEKKPMEDRVFFNGFGKML
ncbi:MAG: nitroreductase family protein [Treponema sp.]|nr:nitroreductase family protein [Candidatus Treponema equifaecale]